MNSKEFVLELQDDSIFVCDMRPGFTEDGVVCELPDGSYDLSIEYSDAERVRSFSLTRKNSSVDGESDIATISVDMARIGLYRSKLLAQAFNGDTEALFDWSDNECEENANPWGGHVGNDAKPDGCYIKLGADCECSVSYLLSEGSKTGLKIVPLTSPVQAAADRSWTRIEIALGNSDVSFMDDRDYDLEFASVLDDVLTELCTIDEGASLIFVDEDSVNVEEKITRFRPMYKGATGCDVFIENSAGGELEIRKLPLETSQAVSQLGENITVKAFAEVIYAIQGSARKLR